VITQSHLLKLFIVKLVLTQKLCSASGLNSSLPAHLRRRNAIVPSPDMILRMTTIFGQPSASSQALQEHAQGSQSALVPDHARQMSGRSERSVVSSGTEHSLWLDPDLEDNL
jgi:hypothetical protein